MKKNRRIGRRWVRRRFRAATITGLPDKVSIGRLATMLGVAMATVQNWIKIGLHSHKQKNRRIVTRPDLIAFLILTGRMKVLMITKGDDDATAKAEV